MSSQLKNRIGDQSISLFLLKWIVISVAVGSLSGTASAWFLMALKWATDYRNENIWLIAFLPLAGVVVAASYKYWGESVVKGNNQLIEEVQEPKKKIPFIMAPLVLFGTVITHLFGGSAGREGTAVQMGGSIADQFSSVFKLTEWERKMLIMCGISGGFASVFGTPWAGTLFAIEIIFIGKLKYEAVLATLVTAFIATYICNVWPIEHTHYAITEIPELSGSSISWILLASLAFGLASIGFSGGMHWLSAQFKKYIKNSLVRPFIGGVIVAGSGYLLGYKYLGLGVPTIVESFTIQQEGFVFLIKLILTVITLSAGFKGGEVTPLFYVGATLGSALSLVLPLPVSLLAGVGFVSVFSGATNAPIACSLMGMELFGLDAGLYITIGCFAAYFVSGNTGIYASQIIGRPKHPFLKGLKGQRLTEMMRK